MLRFLFAGGLLASVLLVPVSAEAGNRQGNCGGVGQRACCVHEELPSCDSGLIEKVGIGPGAGDACDVFGNALGTCYNPGFPSQCGGLNERVCTLSEHFDDCNAGLSAVSGTCRDTGDDFPAGCGRKDQLACTIFQHFPSCLEGLVELLAGTEGSFCREIGQDGFPTHCGHDLQRPCRVSEHLPSCQGSLIEFEGQCRIADDTFPSQCGDENERACTVLEHLPSCKTNLVELFNLSGGGFCRRLDADGFPSHCGGQGEPACQVLEHLPSCKSDAYEIATPKLPALANGWCVDTEDFSDAPFRLDRPTQQAPPGPRTIFLLHGLAGDRRDYNFDALHEPGRGLVRYWVDANWSGDDGTDADPVGVRIFASNDAGATALCNKGTRIDGYTYSVPLTSRLLKGALLDRASCRDPAHPLPPGPVENVTLIAHSMGGVVARDLVYRHYDELLAGGVRIAEVVTLGSPHRGGGSAIPELFNAQWLTCAPAIFTEVLHGTCLLGNWHARLIEERARRDQEGAPYIDNLDFPGIRWITLAAADAQQPTSSPTFTDPIVAQDNLVAHVSGLGIAPDFCFPNVDSQPPPVGVLARSVPNVGESESWIEHFWPPQIVNRSNDALTQPFYDYNPHNDLDVNPAALVTTVPSNAAGSLAAHCHGPGPSSEQPEVPYLAGVNAPDFAEPNQQGSRFFFLGDTGHPHGDLVAGSGYANASLNYIKTLLTDGIRTADINGSGVVDDADRNRLVSRFPGNDPPWVDADHDGNVDAGEDPGAPAGSAFEPGFDVWSDLDGDGFVTLVDLQKWHGLAAAEAAASDFSTGESAPEPPAEPVAQGCGLLGIEPLLLLGLLPGFRRRLRRVLPASFFACLLSGLLPAPPASAAAIVQLVPSATAVALDGSFTVELRADLGLPIVAYGLDVHWNAGLLDYLGPAAFAPGWIQLSNATGASAQPFPALALLNLGALANPGPVSGPNFLLATLSFKAKAPGVANLELSITPTDLTEGFALTTPGSFDSVALSGATVNVIPEPTTALLLAVGLLALGARFRRT